MKGVFCSRCHTDVHIAEYETDGFYVCATCHTPIGYLCFGCDKVYLSNHLGLHGDVYECKHCGQIQWGYTQWKRDREGENL